MDVALLISSFLGLIYLSVWTVSFYPQPLSNIRRRSTAGTSPSYPLLNLLGFTAYTIYTCVFLFSPVIRRQYAARHPQSPWPSVSAFDGAFAAHGFVVVAVTMSQFCPALWGWERRGDGGREGEDSGVVNKVEWWVWGVVALGLAGVVGVIVRVAVAGGGGGADGNDWAWIDSIYALSYLKLFVTLTKYIPQATYNFRRRSTAGWSIAQVLMDFTGGVASVTQLFVDAIRFSNDGGWKDGVGGNMVKFWLGNFSMAFDVVFMVQHFVLYGDQSGKAEDQAAVKSARLDGGRDEAFDDDDDSERRPLLVHPDVSRETDIR